MDGGIYHSCAVLPSASIRCWGFSGDGQLLWSELRRLPAGQRSAIVLRYYLDLPEAQVAQLLGAPQGTVKSWTHRGLARLRERLGAQYGKDPLPRGREAPR